MGLYKDTTGRALDSFSNIPSPPFYNGRFTDGPNVVDQVEALLGSSNTDFFSQPFTNDLVASIDELFAGSVEGITGRVQVPGFVSVEGGATGRSKASGEIELKDAGVKCEYKYKAYDDGAEFVFKSCSKAFSAGDFVVVNGGAIKIAVEKRTRRISAGLYRLLRLSAITWAVPVWSNTE